MCDVAEHSKMAKGRRCQMISQDKQGKREAKEKGMEKSPLVEELSQCKIYSLVID